MDINKLQHIAGSVESSKPAVIRFYGPVTSSYSDSFKDEFLWLQDVIKPSKIIVRINSEGGSVIAGMGVFSIISSCPIEVDCVIDGIAASMGSVIWSAGKNLYMHDYSLLMIHNPFLNGEDSENEKQIIEAFRSQLETVYTKRFGVSSEKVREIMNGKEGQDGTFLTAKDVVKLGIIDKSHVIKTQKAVSENVKNEIEVAKDAASIRNIMSSIVAEVDENKLIAEIEAIYNRDINTKQKLNKQKMDTQVLTTISALLGCKGEPQLDLVSARISELVKIEAELAEAKKQITALGIKNEGTETELKNTKAELEKTKASLKVFEDAKAKAHEAKINEMVENAIKEGKIDAESKGKWVALAHSDFDTVEATLSSIQARENIVQAISQDPTNKKSMSETETEVNAKIKEVFGDDFKLKMF